MPRIRLFSVGEILAGLSGIRDVDRLVLYIVSRENPGTDEVEIIYVGQTRVGMFDRMKQHVQGERSLLGEDIRNLLPWSLTYSVVVVPVLSGLNEIETACIRYWSPFCNIASKTIATPQDLHLARWLSEVLHQHLKSWYDPNCDCDRCRKQRMEPPELSGECPTCGQPWLERIEYDQLAVDAFDGVSIGDYFDAYSEGEAA